MSIETVTRYDPALEFNEGVGRSYVFMEESQVGGYVSIEDYNELQNKIDWIEDKLSDIYHSI